MWPHHFTNNVVEGHFDVTFRMSDSLNLVLIIKYLLNISNVYSFLLLHLTFRLSKVKNKYIFLLSNQQNKLFILTSTKSSRVALQDIEGRMRPTGRSLETTGID